MVTSLTVFPETSSPKVSKASRSDRQSQSGDDRVPRTRVFELSLKHLALSFKLQRDRCTLFVVQARSKTVSLGVAEKDQKRIEKRASTRGTSAHAFMVSPIEQRHYVEETDAAYHIDGEIRLAQMKMLHMVILAKEVFDYSKECVQGETAAKP